MDSFGQDVTNTVEHEITEGVMGRVGGLGDQNSVWSAMDLFRFSSLNVRDFSDGRDGITTYFSANGRAWSSLSFNNEYSNSVTKNNSGDTADFAQQDVFGTGLARETNTLSQTDIDVLDALGWTPATQSRVSPTVTAQGFSVSPNQAVSIASDLSVSNPSGDSLTAYWVEDLGGGGGHLTVGGVSEADGQWFQATSKWSNVQYVGSSSAGVDQLEVAAYDATTGSFVYSAKFNATTISHVFPTIAAQSFSVSPNQAVAIAGDLSVSNPSGDSLTAYWVEDLGGGSGHLTVGGASKADGQWFLATGNWGNVRYVGGPSAGADQLEVAVYDATTRSYVFSSFSATTLNQLTPVAPSSNDTAALLGAAHASNLDLLINYAASSFVNHGGAAIAARQLTATADQQPFLANGHR